MHFDLEKSVLSPVGSPGVSSNPIFFSLIRDSPSENGDNVIWNGEDKFLAENSTGIGFEGLGGIDLTGDGSSGKDFGLHLAGTGDSSDFVSVPSLVLSLLNSPAVSLFSSGWGWSGTVTTLLDIIAGEFVWVLGDIVLAGDFWEPFSVCEFVDSSSVSSIAGSSRVAIDGDLWGESDLGPGVVSLDIDSVSESG